MTPEKNKCPDCQGKGKLVHRQYGNMKMKMTVTDCPLCNGTGKSDAPEKRDMGNDRLTNILRELYIQAQWRALKDKQPALEREKELSHAHSAIQELMLGVDEIVKIMKNQMRQDYTTTTKQLAHSIYKAMQEKINGNK